MGSVRMEVAVDQVAAAAEELAALTRDLTDLSEALVRTLGGAADGIGPGPLVDAVAAAAHRWSDASTEVVGVGEALSRATILAAAEYAAVERRAGVALGGAR